MEVLQLTDKVSEKGRAIFYGVCVGWPYKFSSMSEIVVPMFNPFIHLCPHYLRTCWDRS